MYMNWQIDPDSSHLSTIRLDTSLRGVRVSMDASASACKWESNGAQFIPFDWFG